MQVALGVRMHAEHTWLSSAALYLSRQSMAPRPPAPASALIPNRAAWGAAASRALMPQSRPRSGCRSDAHERARRPEQFYYPPSSSRGPWRWRRSPRAWPRSAPAGTRRWSSAGTWQGSPRSSTSAGTPPAAHAIRVFTVCQPLQSQVDAAWQQARRLALDPLTVCRCQPNWAAHQAHSLANRSNGLPVAACLGMTVAGRSPHAFDTPWLSCGRMQ